MKTIVLIRHGQSTFNEHYERTGQDPGHVDARLTALGQQQARQAREELAATEFDIVVSSPLTRAIQTTHAIFGHRDLPVHVTCRHREKLESSCDVGRSPLHLKEEFPHLDFDHLDDPWWHHEPAVSDPLRRRAAPPVRDAGDRVQGLAPRARGAADRGRSGTAPSSTR